MVWGANYFQNYVLGRKFYVITDHKVLFSLLNRNKKKNKTTFNRLTRWLDRLIPFQFEVEHKPGAKIGLADYLCRNPNDAAVPVSVYDSMFTVAKIRSKRIALGYDQNSSTVGPVIASNQKQLNEADWLYKFSSRNSPAEGVASCEN